MREFAQGAGEKPEGHQVKGEAGFEYIAIKRQLVSRFGRQAVL